MTLKTFKAFSTRWKSKLGLAGWKIKFLFLPEKKMVRLGCDGLSVWQPEYKYAEIEICSDLSDEAVKKTVIHELIHVLTEGHISYTEENPYNDDPQFEFAINVLSSALLNPSQAKPKP